MIRFRKTTHIELIEMCTRVDDFKGEEFEDNSKMFWNVLKAIESNWYLRLLFTENLF